MLCNFLGVEIKQNADNIWIGQSRYCQRMLSEFNMSECKPVATPMECNLKLMKASAGDSFTDKERYTSIVGALLYLSVRTRPDIAFSVGCLAQFSSAPSEKHFIAIKRVLRYLKGTINYGIMYSQSNYKLVGYSDADFAADVDTRKSVSGYVFLLGNGAVSWSSRKQSMVVLSSTESEYVSLCSACREAVWLGRVVSELSGSSDKSVTIYEDNKSAMCIASNNITSSRSKHIDIKLHYVRELIENKAVNLEYCPSELNIADVFTKPLDRSKFVKFREMLGIFES